MRGLSNLLTKVVWARVIMVLTVTCKLKINCWHLSHFSCFLCATKRFHQSKGTGSGLTDVDLPSAITDIQQEAKLSSSPFSCESTTLASLPAGTISCAQVSLSFARGILRDSCMLSSPVLVQIVVASEVSSEEGEGSWTRTGRLLEDLMRLIPPTR